MASPSTRRRQTSKRQHLRRTEEWEGLFSRSNLAAKRNTAAEVPFLPEGAVPGGDPHFEPDTVMEGESERSAV
ncbi:hypothetical protein MRX96_007784 [Rhipicephalus microplus]